MKNLMTLHNSAFHTTLFWSTMATRWSHDKREQSWLALGNVCRNSGWEIERRKKLLRSSRLKGCLWLWQAWGQLSKEISMHILGCYCFFFCFCYSFWEVLVKELADYKQSRMHNLSMPSGLWETLRPYATKVSRCHDNSSQADVQTYLADRCFADNEAYWKGGIARLR